jgi:hypothetical protein
MAPPVDDPARQFDFWLGEWVVRDADGERVGSNVIRRVHDGAALEEQWVGASGVTGSSLSTYDAAEAAWVQCWVDAAGRFIHLAGGFEDGAMHLEATPSTADADRVPFRGRRTPAAAARAVQHFDVAPDGGDWQPWFHGIYEPAAE